MKDAVERDAVYARISDDRDGEQLGVERQLKAGRELVAQRGGKLVMERADNDITALTGKPRPGYQDIMRAAEAGDITHIVVFHTSRLWRNRTERAEGIDLLRKAGVSVVAVKGPALDMSTAAGRGMAGLLGEFDTMESEIKSERIRLKAAELAMNGKIANGGPRPFGYRRVYAGEGPRRKILRDEVNETEAALIREWAKRALAGEPLRSILRDINDRGIRTSMGNKWSQQGLRYMLISGRIAGLKEHKGVVVGPAVWPAIVDRETHEQLRALLTAAGRRTGGVQPRKYYLTGWVWCTCDTRMRAGRFGSSGRVKYVCAPKVEGGCGARLVDMVYLEQMVDAYVIGRLSDPATLRELAAREDTTDARSKEIAECVEADERRLVLLETAMTDGDEDELIEVVKSVRVVRQRIRVNRGQLAQLAGAPRDLWDDVAQVADRWPAAGIDRKQALLALVVSRIVIKPAVRGLGRFDPRRVEIIPR
jgi:DNA invertase Pin-like site-specific DNA recombinase